jgi:hypothetical protein
VSVLSEGQACARWAQKLPRLLTKRYTSFDSPTSDLFSSTRESSQMTMKAKVRDRPRAFLQFVPLFIADG